MASIVARFLAVGRPAVYKLLLLVAGAQIRREFACRILVESEIRGCEAFLQDCHSGEQAHGSSFDFIRRAQQNLAVAFEECTRDAAHDVLREPDSAVVQADLDRGPIQGGAAHAIDAGRVEAHLAQLRIERCRLLPG